MANSIQNLLSTDIQSVMLPNKHRNLIECNVCGASARYSYFGAIVCESCKMFFKRNAELEQKIVKNCRNDRCEINIETRHTCSYCRLQKCLASGMSASMIRPRRYRKNNKRQNQLPTQPNTQISPLVRVRPDSSLFNSNQRILLSNLIHCFDEHGSNLFVRRSNDDQGNYQFEFLSVKTFFESVMNKVQLVLERNRDYLSLPFNDRRALLQLTVEHASGLGGMITLRQHRLFDYPSFYQMAERIFKPDSARFTRQVIEKLDLDNTFLKIMLAIISFSTLNHTVYTGESSPPTMNVKAILKIQDTYAELAWLYLLYKYQHDEAVNKFSNFIRCILLVNRATVVAHESKSFHNIIDYIIEQNQPTTGV